MKGISRNLLRDSTERAVRIAYRPLAAISRSSLKMVACMRVLILVGLLASAGAMAADKAPDPDVLRLHERLAALDADAGAGVAGLERSQARQANDAFVASKPKAKNRAH